MNIIPVEIGFSEVFRLTLRKHKCLKDFILVLLVILSVRIDKSKWYLLHVHRRYFIVV